MLVYIFSKDPVYQHKGVVGSKEDFAKKKYYKLSGAEAVAEPELESMFFKVGEYEVEGTREDFDNLDRTITTPFGTFMLDTRFKNKIYDEEDIGIYVAGDSLAVQEEERYEVKSGRVIHGDHEQMAKAFSNIMAGNIAPKAKHEVLVSRRYMNGFIASHK